MSLLMKAAGKAAGGEELNYLVYDDLSEVADGVSVVGRTTTIGGLPWTVNGTTAGWVGMPVGYPGIGNTSGAQPSVQLVVDLGAIVGDYTIWTTYQEARMGNNQRHPGIAMQANNTTNNRGYSITMSNTGSVVCMRVNADWDDTPKFSSHLNGTQNWLYSRIRRNNADNVVELAKSSDGVSWNVADTIDAAVTIGQDPSGWGNWYGWSLFIATMYGTPPGYNVWFGEFGVTQP